MLPGSTGRAPRALRPQRSTTPPARQMQRPPSRRQLAERGVELVCLAGFMRLLSAEFVERWHDRLINIHPSLLPAFPGLNTHHRALECRREAPRLHGALRPRSHGQRPDHRPGRGAGVWRGTRRVSLAARVLAAEHVLYPKALAVVAADRVRVVNELCVFADRPADLDGPSVLVSPPGHLTALPYAASIHTRLSWKAAPP